MSVDFVAIEAVGKNGILTCVGIKKVGGQDLLYGVSAAHVLLGANKKPDYTDRISIYNSSSSPSFSPAGITEKAIYINGIGEHPNWGILDAGCFLFNRKYREYLMPRIVPLKRSSRLDRIESLENMNVYGYSVQNEERLKGVVEKAFVTVKNKTLKFDLAIRFVNGKTEEGDSGMLWKSQNGSAVAMHIYGNSIYSFATIITRVRQALDLSFYRIKID